MSDSAASGAYIFGIDRGGTFTDIVAWQPDGKIVVKKVLSNRIGQTVDSALVGIRQVLGLDEDAAIPDGLIEAVCMGTTVGTNALLERQGEPTIFVTTKGFRDALRIGYQNRPRLFDLNIDLPTQLYKDVVEVDERLAADGKVMKGLDEDALRAQLKIPYDLGFRSCAIAFMHGYRFPEHEVVAARIAKEIGFAQVSTSHESSGMIKFVARGATAVVDAYLTPILQSYTQRLDKSLGKTPLFFMQSNGGLTQSSKFKGKDCVLSGPAGGIVGAVASCTASGIKNIIGFDMGGTSTDVWHYAGHFERTSESQIAGTRIRSPVMMIHTVAAGGGSILGFDGIRFQVGPESAGAVPGPAAYRNGGPLAVTDCNIVLGRIPPQLFPSVFGPGGNEALDAVRSHDLFEELTSRVNAASGTHKTRYECAEGFFEIAVENMANAIKKISTERGYELAKYTLCSFGGAGGQHACRVAETLGMKSVFVHPLAGVLSAYGMGLSDLRAIESASVERLLTSEADRLLIEDMKPLEDRARQKLVEQGVHEEDIVVVQRAIVRHRGSSSGLEVVFDEISDLRSLFVTLPLPPNPA